MDIHYKFGWLWSSGRPMPPSPQQRQSCPKITESWSQVRFYSAQDSTRGRSQMGATNISKAPEWVSESRSVESNSLQPHGLYSPWNSPGQNTGVGSCPLLQRIIPTQESNPGLLHCRRILHQLVHQESPRILEWVAHPFFRGSSWPRNRTRVSCIADSLPAAKWKPPFTCNKHLSF